VNCKVNGIPKVCPNKECRAINSWTLVQYGRWPGNVPSGHPCHVDGWSEIMCNHCGMRIGGWSGRILNGTFDDGEHEAPYNGAHRPGCKFAPRKLTLVS
jgi:hypothetical protein